MTTTTDEVLEASASGQEVEERARALFKDRRRAAMSEVDRLFVFVMAAQWAFGLLIAFTVSPYAWAGTVKTVHVHVQIALFLGGALSAFPIVLAILRPGEVVTRHVMAISQMLWSALLIHLTGGRIETHFHVFGSLAFLAFYLDWQVLVTATLVVAADHFLRGLVWPQSVYGIANPESWRFLEHAGWVVFENVVLFAWCIKGTAAMRQASEGQAQMEVVSDIARYKMAALEMAMNELGDSRAGSRGVSVA